MQQRQPVVFSIVAARDGVATDVVKKALDSKLEDIVYRTSVSFTEDLDASRLQKLLQLQTADVKINIGQTQLSLLILYESLTLQHLNHLAILLRITVVSTEVRKKVCKCFCIRLYI